MAKTTKNPGFGQSYQTSITQPTRQDINLHPITEDNSGPIYQQVSYEVPSQKTEGFSDTKTRVSKSVRENDKPPEDLTTLKNTNEIIPRMPKSTNNGFKFPSPKLAAINTALICLLVALVSVTLTFCIITFININVQENPENRIEETTQSITTAIVSTDQPSWGTPCKPASSCIELYNAGYGNGTYTVQFSNKLHEVYCDMTGGGGWMLVATVNQNTFANSVNYDDSWFIDYTDSTKNALSFMNWVNNYTFGTIDTCTSMDYKNEGFFEYQGGDVMIRHVPNHTPVEVSRERSFLEYQTENQFMFGYGGNLQQIFTDQFQLNPSTVVYPDVSSVLYRLAARSAEISGLLSDFYFYDYGSADDQLADGGNGMFTSYGMQLHMDFNQQCVSGRNCFGEYLKYATDYTCSSGNTIWSSRKTHPFFGLLAVGNFDGCFETFELRVHSHRPASDIQIILAGNQTINEFTLHYDARCRYDMTSPSMCDVMFYITNKIWNSVGNLNVNASYTTSDYYVYMRSNEPMSNIIVGYTMLSRKDGKIMLESELQASMSKILEIVAESSDFCPDCFYQNVLAVPVQYSIGNNATVDSMLPPSVKPLPTGFIQFRAYGSSGSVYAMCPAVRVNDWRSEYVCIGGMKNPTNSLVDDCNDFTHWNGMPGTRTNKTFPVEFSHSERDLDSTIMIFYK